MKKYIFKKDKGVIGCLAHCIDCEWMEEHYQRAITAANKHAKETGHTIAIEKTTSWNVSASGMAYSGGGHNLQNI